MNLIPFHIDYINLRDDEIFLFYRKLKMGRFLSVFRLFQTFITYLFVCCTKKLFEFPVERDFPKEKAFKAVQYPFLFQIFLRIRFFDVEVRFFGTAI